MSIQKESIQVIAQSKGLPRLKDDVCQTLATDVEYRIREIVQESLKFMKHSKRNKLQVEDINHALKLKNIESIYGYKQRKEEGFKKVPNRKLYFIQDSEMKIQDILQTTLPKIPVGPTIGSHWLAIEGVQPKISQNPTQPENEKIIEEEKIDEVKEDKHEVKSLVKHVLSAELQMYYEKVIEVIKKGKRNDDLLRSLASDAGIQQLVPYFSQFISQEVTENLRKLDLLTNLMEMTYSLILNPNLQVELYLHQFIPSILTCLVGKRLCEDPKENHWSLRDFSAQIIAFICQKFSSCYNTLQPRITKSLLHAFLDPTKPRSTHYGAIVGITSLGIQVTKVLLLEPSKNSNLKVFYQFLEPELTSNDSNKRHEAIMCYNALKRSVQIFFDSIGQSKIDLKREKKNSFKEEKEDEMIIEQKEEIEEEASISKLTKILKDNDEILDKYFELNEIFGEISNLIPYSKFENEMKPLNEIYL